jgi:pantoate--beta-alanine ligase
VGSFLRGERAAVRLRAPVEAAISGAGLRLDYVELRGPDELDAIDDGATASERALLAVAAFAGTTRLIDNVVLGEDGAPCPELA